MILLEEIVEREVRVILETAIVADRDKFLMAPQDYKGNLKKKKE